MDEGRPESIVFTGSEREKICKTIESSVSLPCITVEKYRKLDHPENVAFVILCPLDNQELEKMYTDIGKDLLAPAVLSAVILSFSPDSNPGFSVFLHRSDFAVEVLRRMTFPAGTSMLEAVNMNRIRWERIGSLLPFYIHNMNNILARIMGNIELAEFHSGQTEKVNKKLAVALEGTEELSRFLERLAVFSTSDDDESAWTLGNEVDILEQSQMSSGTSVKFSYEEKSGMPRKLPVRKNLMNLLTGLIAASATISVNGCGSIKITVSPRGEAAEFRASWNSSAKDSGLCSNSMDSAADLLSQAALMASLSNLSFRLDRWNSESGSASVLVPVRSKEIL